jgi:hypothetical protein
MRGKVVDILHELLTSHLFIFAGAIVLFLLVNALLGPGKVEPVITPLWT